MNFYNKWKIALYKALADDVDCWTRLLIWADQDGPRPEKFATIKILSFTEPETNEERYDFQTAEINSISRIVSTVSIQFYGENSFSDLHEFKKNLRQRSKQHEIYIALKNEGIEGNLVFTNQVQNLSQLQGSNFEDRASMDITFNLVDEKLDIGYNEVEGNYEISDLKVNAEFINLEDEAKNINKVIDII